MASKCERIASGMFYRGIKPGETQRIRTGNGFWDHLFFVADNERAARMYGGHVFRYRMRPGVRLLCEGSKEFVAVAGRWRKGESLLDYASRVARAAESAGYDAVWFQRQADVGTAVIHPDVLIPEQPSPFFDVD